MSLSALGLDAARRAVLESALPDGMELARVMAVNRLNLELETDHGACLGELAGRLRFAAESESELPAVGDWVAIQRADDFAVVLEVLDRRTVLQRRRPGQKTASAQVVAANVDTAFIVHGCDRPYNARRMERFAAMVHAGGVEPAVILSKADLMDGAVLQEMVAQAERVGPVIAVRALESGGLEDLKSRLTADRTYAFLGPSGAGKTTILNTLMGHALFATAPVREADQKGKHTTTRRHLVRLPGGALLVDTPGMRELGMTDMQEGVQDTFPLIAERAALCRYRDCTHQTEPGCAVRAAIRAGEIDEVQLEAFHKLEREVARFQRSIAEQRQKDKAQGKLYKSIQAGKRQRR